MLKEKIQNFIKNKTGDNNKKNIENLIVFLVLLIITVIAINTIWKKDNEQTEEKSQYKVLAENTEKNNLSSNILEYEEYNLEDKLTDILSKMNGVGMVKVLITYSKTSSVIPIYSETENTSQTEETDSNRRNEKANNF